MVCGNTRGVRRDAGSRVASYSASWKSALVARRLAAGWALSCRMGFLGRVLCLARLGSNCPHLVGYRGRGMEWFADASDSWRQTRAFAGSPLCVAHGRDVVQSVCRRVRRHDGSMLLEPHNNEMKLHKVALTGLVAVHLAVSLWHGLSPPSWLRRCYGRVTSWPASGRSSSRCLVPFSSVSITITCWYRPTT